MDQITPPSERELLTERHNRNGGESDFVRNVKRKKPVKYWHEAIVNDLLAFPLDTGKVRAARLGYSESYLNVIINSDMFKAFHAARRREFAERLDNSLVHKTAECAGKALDLLLETMETKRTAIPFEKLSDFADKSLARLGYGNSGKSAAVQVNVDNRMAVAVTQEELASARSALRSVENSRAEQTKLLPNLEEVESEEV